MKPTIRFYIFDFKRDSHGILQNFKSKLLALLLLLFISVIAVLHLLAVDRSFSESENRMLKQLPHFSLKALLSGDFTADFENMCPTNLFSETFGSGQNRCGPALGKKESNGVYLGTNGYLIQEVIPRRKRT